MTTKVEQFKSQVNADYNNEPLLQSARSISRLMQNANNMDLGSLTTKLQAVLGKGAEELPGSVVRMIGESIAKLATNEFNMTKEGYLARLKQEFGVISPPRPADWSSGPIIFGALTAPALRTGGSD